MKAFNNAGLQMSGNYQAEDLISIGCPVVLRKLVKGRRFYFRQETVRDGKLGLKGLQFNLSDAVGQPYGTLFRIDNQRMLPVEDVGEFDQFEGQMVSDLGAVDTGGGGGDGVSGGSGDGVAKDNRNIVDTADNQKLKEADLTDLKQSGETGRQVIEQLIGHSANFEQKTAFSQEKYVRKKKEKYLDYVSVLRPTARVLSELRGRGMNLRVDMLSQLLAYANVHYESRVLLLDDSHNMLLAHAVCERLTGHGRLCVLGANQSDLTNRLAPSLRERHSHLRLHAVPLSMVSSLLARRQQRLSAAEPDAGVGVEPEAKRQKVELEPEDAKAQRRAELQQRLLDDQEVLATSDWDCLIVASKFSPLSLTPLLDFLLLGKPFAFYSPHQEPLLALGLELKARGRMLTPVLFDSFLRKYQIMPNRCRPHLKMVASSGFALVGRLCSDGNQTDADSDEA